MQVSMCYFQRMETLEINLSFFKKVIFINKKTEFFISAFDFVWLFFFIFWEFDQIMYSTRLDNLNENLNFKI